MNKIANDRTYYHYTDNYAASSIIKNKEFWGFSFMFMNDVQEYKFMLNLLEIHIKNIQRQHNNELSDYFGNILYNVKFKQDYVMPYLISFSTKKDDLNQWRSYAKDGKGVCVGVQFNECVKTFKINELLAMDISNVYFTWFQIEVEYWDMNTNNKIEDFLNKEYKRLECLFGKEPPFISNEKYSDFEKEIFYLYQKLWFISICVKNHYFKEEKEVRLFYYAPMNMYTQKYNPEFIENSLFFREMENGIKSYVKLQQPFFDIKEIILGPKNISYIADYEYMLLKNEILGGIVSKSKIPLQ